jgi:hypothetical protein
MALLGRKPKKKEPADEAFSVQAKRCPECFINLPLDAKKCFSCRTRVGKVDKYGKARKSPNWTSYIICIISWAILIGYIQWAFLD